MSKPRAPKLRAPDQWPIGHVTMHYTEHLMQPATRAVAYRLRSILQAVADMIPDTCPHCGAPIKLKPSRPG